MGSKTKKQTKQNFKQRITNLAGNADQFLLPVTEIQNKKKLEEQLLKGNLAKLKQQEEQIKRLKLYKNENENKNQKPQKKENKSTQDIQEQFKSFTLLLMNLSLLLSTIIEKYEPNITRLTIKEKIIYLWEVIIGFFSNRSSSDNQLKWLELSNKCVEAIEKSISLISIYDNLCCRTNEIPNTKKQNNLVVQKLDDVFVKMQNPLILKNNAQINQILNKCQDQKRTPKHFTSCKSILNLNTLLNVETTLAPVALLMGQRQTDLDFIMKSLFPNKQTKQYCQYTHQSLGISIINTEEFDFEDIDQREKQIKQYQKLFYDKNNLFLGLWVVIQFERLDIMKASFMQIYKFIIKLQIPISIIVTKINLSNEKDQVQDMQQIKDKFKLFNIANFIFLTETISSSDLERELNKTFSYSAIKLKETIFELENLQEQNQILKNLEIQFTRFSSM